MSDWLELKDAARLLGMGESTLRKKLIAKEIPGRQVEWGLRHKWQIHRSTIEGTRPKEEYETLLARWEAETVSGLHTGRPMGERTVKNYRYMLNTFWRALGVPESVSEFTPGNLKKVYAALKPDHENRRCRYASKEAIQKAVCSFARWLVVQGMMSDIQLIQLQQARPERLYEEHRPALSREERFKLIQTNLAVHAGRDELDIWITHMILMLGSYAGLRRNEIANLEPRHVLLKEREILVVDGKGHKDGLIGIDPELYPSLVHWLKIRPKSKWLVPQRDGKKLTPKCFQNRIDTAEKRAGVTFNTHALRRTCGTALMADGVDLDTIKETLRHNSIVVTQLYLRGGQKAAANRLKSLTRG